MRILIGGYWDPKRAIRFEREGRQLGKLLAEKGHDLILGPGSGVVRYVAEGFKSVAGKGKTVFYVPHLSELRRVGEKMDELADEIIRTNDDYLRRTIRMCEVADAYASIAGASGTILEAVSMMFLKKPVAILEEAGAASNAAQILGGLKVYAYFAPTVTDMVEYLEKRQPVAHQHEFEEEWYNV